MINLLGKPKQSQEGQEGPINKYSAIIIGAGGQGALSDTPTSGKIISFSHAVKEHPGFELVGFVDKNEDMAMNAAQVWNGTYYTNLSQAFYGQRDVAIISTPDDTHYEILKELANYPLRLVICEKPLCKTVEQAKEIIALYSARGTLILVNYTRRFLPYYEKLKQYGKPLFGICNFNRGWVHTATHAIDFFEMIGLKDYKILEHKINSRIWELIVWFDGSIVWTEKRFEEDPVWPYYNKTHWHIMDNAYNFLEGWEPLKCTGEMALKSLEICFELMNKK